MHAFEFLRNPGQGTVKPIYAVTGEDAFLRRETLSAIIRTALGAESDDLAATSFAGETARLSDVLDEVRTLPFLARCRVALVEGADPFVTAHRKELEAYAERPSTAGVLVLAVKAWPSSTKLAKLVEKVGLTVDCKAPPERELPPWLVALAKSSFGVKFEDEAARLLVELVGPEPGLLASEVDKLSIYVGKGHAIRRQDVVKMVGAGRVETIWRTVEAATTGKGAEALRDLERLITSGEHPRRPAGDDVVVPAQNPSCRSVAAGPPRPRGRLPPGRDHLSRRDRDGPQAARAPRPRPRRPPARFDAPRRPGPQGCLDALPPRRPGTPARGTLTPPRGLTIK